MENLKLSLHNPDLTTATRIAQAVNTYLGGNMAVIFGIFGSIPAARPRPATDLDASDARFDALRTVSVAEAVTRLATLIGHPR